MDVLALLTPARELIETDRGNGAEQAHAGNDRKKNGISGPLVVITTAAMPMKV